MSSKKIWIVAVGEPLPTDPGPPRLLRKGMLAQRLAARGHEVTWFTSAFNHQRKVMREATTVDVPTPSPQGDASFELVTLPATGYTRHVSLARLRDHRFTAEAFRHKAVTLPRPDVICVSFPTIEISLAATDHALSVGCPSVVDIRDLWPDIFGDRVPAPLTPLSRLALRPLENAADRACRQATSLVGISDEFLEWGLRRAGRPRGDDHVFPLAYEPPDVDPAGAADAREFWDERGVTADQVVVSFVGSLTRVFDFDHIVEAARRTQDVLFVIAGDGPLRRELEDTAPSNLLVPGWLGGKEARELLQRSRAALAPYVPRHDFEGTYSNKVIEYLASGLPILTSLCTGATADLLRKEAIGVSYPLGADGLARALGHLDDPDWIAAGARATAVFESRFHADAVYGPYCDLLEQLAG